jgi:hypothetical protein
VHKQTNNTATSSARNGVQRGCEKGSSYRFHVPVVRSAVQWPASVDGPRLLVRSQLDQHLDGLHLARVRRTVDRLRSVRSASLDVSAFCDKLSDLHHIARGCRIV